MKMEIVSSTDKNFIMPLGIMMHSLVKNNPDEKIHFHLLIDESVDEQAKRLLTDMAGDKDVSFYFIDGSRMNGLPKLGTVNTWVSKASYYRLYMTDFLPESLEKVLYLDGDIVVRHRLDDLWNMDITDVAMAGVIDQCDASISNYNRMGYRPEKHYVNAGVLLLNLKYWREHHAKEQFLKMMKDEPEKITFHDQDVLNYVFRDSKCLLPLRYNVQTSFYEQTGYVNFDYWAVAEELEAAIRDPCILHYSSGLKPWIKGCTHPLRKEFERYKADTPWRNVPLQAPRILFKTKVKHFLENIGFISKEPDRFRHDLSLDNK